jgi:protein-L-isoaspartate O-methyltransferase
MGRNYYVIKENGKWKVKLERGRVVSIHRKQKAAKREAKRLARRYNRGVTVNAAEGYTRYHIKKDEL